MALLLNFPSASPLRVSNNRSIFKPPSGIVDRAAPPTRRRPRRRRLSPSTIVLRASPSRRERDATFTHRPRTRASTRARPRHHRTVRESQKRRRHRRHRRHRDDASHHPRRRPSRRVARGDAPRVAHLASSRTARASSSRVVVPLGTFVDASLFDEFARRRRPAMSTRRVASPRSFARRTRAAPFARRARGAVRAFGAARDDDDVPTSSESTDDGARLERWRARARAMRVKTLKERLSSMNLRHDDCLEKSELVDRAARAWLTRARTEPRVFPFGSWGSGGMSPRSGYAVVTLDVGVRSVCVILSSIPGRRRR